MKLLADTSALLALAMREDQNHASAAAFVRQNLKARFVLTELILAEFVTRIRARAGAGVAVEAGNNVLQSQRYRLVFIDADLLRGGLARMVQLADKRLSLTDCISFETMVRLGLPGAFSFDRDFRDCGFQMLP